MRKNKRCPVKQAVLVAAFAGLTASAPAWACEPVLPLAQALSGGLFLLPSLTFLAVAVAAKAVTFAVLERRLSWWRAIVSMCAANLFSSVIGVLVSFAAIVPMLILFSLPLVYILSLVPAARLRQAGPAPCNRMSARSLAAAVVLLYVITWVLFGFSQFQLGLTVAGPAYWPLKFAYLFVALVISIFLTTIWEEWIVSRVSGSAPGEDYLGTVLKANLVTLFVIMLYAAAMMLPKRLASPDFLVFLRPVRDAVAGLL